MPFSRPGMRYPRPWPLQGGLDNFNDSYDATSGFQIVMLPTAALCLYNCKNSLTLLFQSTDTRHCFVLLLDLETSVTIHAVRSVSGLTAVSALSVIVVNYRDGSCNQEIYLAQNNSIEQHFRHDSVVHSMVPVHAPLHLARDAWQHLTPNSPLPPPPAFPMRLQLSSPEHC